MRNNKRNQHGPWTTVIVAIFFVAQAFLGSFVSSGQASPQNLDYFGNVICINGTQSPDDDGTTDTKHILDCCNIGCSMFASAVEARLVSASIHTSFAVNSSRYHIDLNIFFRKNILFGSSLPRAPPFFS